MSKSEFTPIDGVSGARNEQISGIIMAHRMADTEVRDLLKGHKVRFKAWTTGGIQRTGTIVDASIQGKSIAIGVAVDRLDGRSGTLIDTWYGWIANVEVVE